MGCCSVTAVAVNHCGIQFVKFALEGLCLQTQHIWTSVLLAMALFYFCVDKRHKKQGVSVPSYSEPVISFPGKKESMLRCGRGRSAQRCQ